MDHEELTSRLRELGFERIAYTAFAHIDGGVEEWTHPHADAGFYIIQRDDEEFISVAMILATDTVELFLNGFEQGLQAG